MTKQWLIVRLKVLPISFHVNRQVPLILLTIALIASIGIILSLANGEYQIAPLEVVKTLFGLETNNRDLAFIINTLRLPRTLVAFLVGVGLAIAGTITQSITRNPLASPSIIGINAGASLSAVSLLVIFPNIPIAVLPFAAFGGALTVSLLIYWLAWDGGSSPVQLILVGVGFSSIANALTNLTITFGDINHVSQALVWLAGSVYGRSTAQVLALVPWIAIFGLLALLLASELNTLNLGDDTARCLGIEIELKRGLLLLTSTALAGASVATAGAIGFIGLMAPHLARSLVGNSHQGLLPVAAMLGGTIVVWADLLGRLLFSPIELPCGVVTAAIGAPYFLYLLSQNRKK